jgi:5-methylthioribose kinase
MTLVKNLADGFRLCCLPACDFIPHLHGCGSQFAVLVGRNIVAWKVKEVGDGVMNGNETLEVSG